MTLFFHTFAQNLETLHQQGRQLSMLAYVTGAEDEMIQLVPARHGLSRWSLFWRIPAQTL